MRRRGSFDTRTDDRGLECRHAPKWLKAMCFATSAGTRSAKRCRTPLLQDQSGTISAEQYPDFAALRMLLQSALLGLGAYLRLKANCQQAPSCLFGFVGSASGAG